MADFPYWSKLQNSYKLLLIQKRFNIAIENTRDKLLKTLSRHGNEFTRADIARSNNTPIDILNELTLDDSYNVRIEVADNKNSSIQILLNLIKDKNPGVSEIASMNLSKRTIVYNKY